MAQARVDFDSLNAIGDALPVVNLDDDSANQQNSHGIAFDLDAWHGRRREDGTRRNGQLSVDGRVKQLLYSSNKAFKKGAITRSHPQPQNKAQSTNALVHCVLERYNLDKTLLTSVNVDVFIPECLGHSSNGELTLTASEKVQHVKYAKQLPARINEEIKVSVNVRGLLAAKDMHALCAWIQNNAEYIQEMGVNEWWEKNKNHLYQDETIKKWLTEMGEEIHAAGLTNDDVLKFGPGSPIVLSALYHFEQRYKDAVADCERALEDTKLPFAAALQASAEKAMDWWNNIKKRTPVVTEKQCVAHAFENFAVFSSFLDTLETAKKRNSQRLMVLVYPNEFSQIELSLFEHGSMMQLETSYCHVHVAPAYTLNVRDIRRDIHLLVGALRGARSLLALTGRSISYTEEKSKLSTTPPGELQKDHCEARFSA